MSEVLAKVAEIERVMSIGRRPTFDEAAWLCAQVREMEAQAEFFRETAVETYTVEEEGKTVFVIETHGSIFEYRGDTFEEALSKAMAAAGPTEGETER